MSTLVLESDTRTALDAASAIFASLGDTLICVDSDRRIAWAPQRLRDLVGRSVADAFGSETDALLRLGELAQVRTELRTPIAQPVVLTLAPFAEQAFRDIAYVITLRADERSSSEADRIRGALEAHRWRRDAAAKALGISRATLWRKMRSFGLL